MPTYQAEDLKQFGQKAFEAIGVKKEYAKIAADALVRANLEGVDSHGISRLAIYVNRMSEAKTINAKPAIQVEKKGEAILLVDGDNGLGQITSYVAVEEGIKLAKETGIAAIGVRNSNHFGTASYFCQMACKENMAAMAFTNSPSGIAPWGGIKPFFGTNPIAFGFPTDDEKPVIIDMSTSIVARGKIILAAKEDKPIPKGWAIDVNGNETEDPNQALQGAVLPVGGAKGYALALAVEILTGVLSGAAFGPNVKNIYNETIENANVGHFFILMDVEKFMPIEQFQQIMSIFIEDMKETPKQQGVDEILYPGERRNREYQKRSQEGIDISEQVKEELMNLATNIGIEFPKDRVKA